MVTNLQWHIFHCSLKTANYEDLSQIRGNLSADDNIGFDTVKLGYGCQFIIFQKYCIFRLRIDCFNLNKQCKVSTQTV